MLTKLGMMAMTATIGTAAVGGTASANEPCNDNNNNTRVERGYDHGAPVGAVDVRYDGRSDGRSDGRYDGRYDGGYDGRVGDRFGVREREFARRRAYEQMMRERQRRAWEHARWLHQQHGYGNRGW